MWGLFGRVVEATRTDSAGLGLRRREADAALLRSWTHTTGERANVRALLEGARRRARPTRLWLTRAAEAFAWEEVDARTGAWMPQGISTSADAHGSRDTGRTVVVSWYSPTVAGRTEGARITVVDMDATRGPRYEHVLLVDLVREAATGAVSAAPVRTHAGGIVWYRDLLYVASTYEGLRVFDLADLVRVDPVDHGGYAYLLPQRWTYAPDGDPTAAMRYSFVSLDRTSTPHCLVAGEYGRGEARTRVVRLRLDAPTGHLAADGTADGTAARPSDAFGLGIHSMQGVACVDGTYYVGASHGRHVRGDLWVGTPGRGFGRNRWALPVGPEDLSVVPERGLLCTLTEWPGRRSVLALRAADWSG